VESGQNVTVLKLIKNSQNLFFQLLLSYPSVTIVYTVTVIFQAFNKEECMTYLDEEKAHVTSLDAGEVFVAGRYHSLIPIMQEVYSGMCYYICSIK
jgi:hypothetical protein